MGEPGMEKLEAVQRVLRFSARIRDWCTNEHSVYFDDFDEHNVHDYDPGGYGKLTDTIIDEGISENIIDEEDID